MVRGNQLTVMKLITLLETVQDKNVEVKFDFGYFGASGLDSWRGDYSHLAISYSTDKVLSVKELLELLENAIGDTFTGYKGGEYQMFDDTPLWIANVGEACNTVPVRLIDNRFNVVLCTEYEEY